MYQIYMILVPVVCFIDIIVLISILAFRQSNLEDFHIKSIVWHHIVANNNVLMTIDHPGDNGRVCNNVSQLLCCCGDVFFVHIVGKCVWILLMMRMLAGACMWPGVNYCQLLVSQCYMCIVSLLTETLLQGSCQIM